MLAKAPLTVTSYVIVTVQPSGIVPTVTLSTLAVELSTTPVAQFAGAVLLILTFVKPVNPAGNVSVMAVS